MRDANEPEIIERLRQEGCFVDRLNGSGQPDLLVIAGPNPPLYVVRSVPEAIAAVQEARTNLQSIALIEVKSPRGALTPAQKDWHNAVAGIRLHVGEAE